MKTTSGSATEATRRRKRVMYSSVLRGVSFHRSRPRSTYAVTKQWSRLSASRTWVVALSLTPTATGLVAHRSAGAEEENEEEVVALSANAVRYWRKAVDTCSATNETARRTAMRAAADRTTPPSRLDIMVAIAEGSERSRTSERSALDGVDLST
jgi:hypothetical protein